MLSALVGTDKFQKDTVIRWIPEGCINPHLLIIGTSGSGKSYRIRKFVDQIKTSGIRIHMFDVHGDLDIESGYQSTVSFSNSSSSGINPLRIMSDPEMGGVRMRIKTFTNMINRYSAKIGIRQEGVLRALMLDLYAANGIYYDNPASWVKSKYPTLMDLKRFSYAKLKSLIFGDGDSAMRHLDKLNKAVVKLDRKLKVTKPNETGEDIDQAEVDKYKSECIEYYSNYISGIRNGRELDAYIRYDSKDVLKSVYDRIDSLSEFNIFKDVTPDFDENAPVWRYMLKSLSREEQSYAVELFLENIFMKAKQRGISKTLRQIIVLDEAHRFIADEPDHIVNILVKESRKFGIGVLFSTQNFSHLTDDIISNTATKVILATDNMYHESLGRKLGLEVKRLRFVQPRRSGIIQMKTTDSLNGKFTDVIFSD